MRIAMIRRVNTEFMQEKQLSNQIRSVDPAQSPACCGTGCTVCVLDYWEDEYPDSSEMQLLEAIEEAQLQARVMQDRSGSE